jgi:hypothetical protein
MLLDAVHLHICTSLGVDLRVVLGSLATQEFLQIPINILVEYIVERKKRERTEVNNGLHNIEFDILYGYREVMSDKQKILD